MLTIWRQFLQDYLAEAGALEAAYCAASCGASLHEWLALNAELGARKLARESRDGSAAMGRRFLRLAANMSGADAAERKHPNPERKFIWRPVLVWLRASWVLTPPSCRRLISSNR